MIIIQNADGIFNFSAEIKPLSEVEYGLNKQNWSLVAKEKLLQSMPSIL